MVEILILQDCDRSRCGSARETVPSRPDDLVGLKGKKRDADQIVILPVKKKLSCVMRKVRAALTFMGTGLFYFPRLANHGEGIQVAAKVTFHHFLAYIARPEIVRIKGQTNCQPEIARRDRRNHPCSHSQS